MADFLTSLRAQAREQAIREFVTAVVILVGIIAASIMLWAGAILITKALGQ